MKLEAIKDSVGKCLGIAELNPMQTAVSVAEANRIILLAPTGSGKTIAFTLALLKRVNTDGAGATSPCAVVIAPSRELVRQIESVIRPVAATFGLKTLALYGGNDFRKENASLGAAIPEIVVATPGRLLDHINRQSLDLGFTDNVVIDEYDKTLELGFHDELKKIVRGLGEHLPAKSPAFAMLTSATPISELPGFMRLDDAETIDYTVESPVESRLRIMSVPSFQKDKLETLAALIGSIHKNGSVIVFVNHRESAERVGDFLTRKHISNVVYHGGLDQQQREMALAIFDSDAASVLVSTDLAGRGIDISGVSSIIHYHQTSDEATWKHRNGRTARVDRHGEVYVITSPDEGLMPFVNADRDYYPDMTSDGAVRPKKDVIYIDKGRHDKISKGDIAGFIMKKAGIPATSLGKITLGNKYALAAVDHEYVSEILEAAKSNRLKNTRFRASLLKS